MSKKSASKVRAKAKEERVDESIVTQIVDDVFNPRSEKKKSSPDHYKLYRDMVREKIAKSKSPSKKKNRKQKLENEEITRLIPSSNTNYKKKKKVMKSRVPG